MVVKWINNLLKKIFEYSTIGPALIRYYILPRIKLHYIHSSDEDFHTHPWNGWSFILGHYTEHVPNEANDGYFEHERWFFNRVYAYRPHRVIIKKPVWTLFIHGPRVNENWQYGEAVRPWNGSDKERKNNG